MTQADVDWLTKELIHTLKQETGKDSSEATHQDIYYAVGGIVQEKIKPKWMKTQQKYEQKQTKQVYYLSMEFLIGSLMESNLLNIDMLDTVNQALEKLNVDPKEIYGQEHDPGLGNGGLGRLAAGFLDSLASLNYGGHGYGIRYRYGLFKQRIIQGNQIELPDHWLKDPFPWEVRREEEAVVIHFRGDVHMLKKQNGDLEFNYENTDQVLAVPYDIPIVGYQNDVVNTLRLWSAEPVERYKEPLRDEYYHELDQQHGMEQISGYLYPDDSDYEGKELRLKQQYFLVSATLKNILKTFKQTYSRSLEKMPEKVVIQINDTHPSLAIPEFMRLLMDDEHFSWDRAWDITTNVFAYTNHTTLIEAFETWPVDMMQPLLPRIYMIIDEINEQFCQYVWKNHEKHRDRIQDMAVIADGQVHMAHLAIVGSFSVNGVASMHTEILKNRVLHHFYTIFPNRFNNKTNGITHRRWLLQANPKLANLITEMIGARWIRHPEQLISLLQYSRDQYFLEKINEIKLGNKRILKQLIYERTGITVDEHSIFDVQVKRLHEYKRQLLKVFHILYLYHELKTKPDMDRTPRTFIFGAKAAPGYHLAKEVIKLINQVATVINNDLSINDKLKVIFMENYNVSLAEDIIPAADISEQISTAGKEASGTGNMKMMMNGALTVGTLDGANVEIKKAVGDKNIFIFGLTAEEVSNYQTYNGYKAMDLYHSDDRIKYILDQLNEGLDSGNIEFKDLYNNILYHNDPYFVLKDFESYVEIQEHVEHIYRDRWKWLHRSVINIAYSGKFSSDRTIREYAAEIWKIKQV